MLSKIRVLKVQKERQVSGWFCEAPGNQKKGFIKKKKKKQEIIVFSLEIKASSIAVKNSLQFSADLGALDLFQDFICLRVQICEVVVELVNCDFPGSLLWRNASGMAAWFRETHISHLKEPESGRQDLFTVLDV